MTKQTHPTTIALLREAEKAQNHLHQDDCNVAQAARDAVEFIDSLILANYKLTAAAKEVTERMEDICWYVRDLRKEISRAP